MQQHPQNTILYSKREGFWPHIGPSASHSPIVPSSPSPDADVCVQMRLGARPMRLCFPLVQLGSCRFQRFSELGRRGPADWSCEEKKSGSLIGRLE